MKTISIDFDGVIHKYSKGWADGTCYDKPIDGSLDFIHQLLQEEYSVFILSTRNPIDIDRWFINADMPYGVSIPTYIIPEDVVFWNQKYCLGITNRKLPAHLYIDDRGVTFEGDFTNLRDIVRNFKTWQNM